MLEKIKSAVQWVISKKDIITSVAGFLTGLTYAVNDYFVSGQKVTATGLIIAVGIWLGGWFSGKTKKQG